MTDKLKIAVSWAAACGGCDVSILDIEERVLSLVEIADIVYWPVAVDFKREDLLALEDGSVDIGIFNGALRTSEQEADARIFRAKCKLLVACGSCACFGGIPGLGNLASKQEIFDVAYRDTPSTENPDDVRPQTETAMGEHLLTLPEFTDRVRHLSQVVQVDLFMPGCPPPVERINDLIDAAAAYATTGELPPIGAFIAEDKALCDTCPRNETRQTGRITAINRPHQVALDPNRCFLEQGVVCMGIATRGGCGHTCIKANMPCRGCFGPTPGMLDPGAEAISAIGTIAGAANENHVPPHKMKKTVRSLSDPAGTFYRFTLPSALLNRVFKDAPKEE